MTNLNFGDAAGQDVRGAVQYLKSRCAKVGVTGFCMGGALTLLAAVNVPEADAAVVWYGFPPLEYIDASKIKMPMLGHYAIDDVPFPIDKVDELEGKLRAARVDFEFHRYAAKHAFANETQVGANKLPITEYNAEAAALAWTRTLSFFDRHLR
jgi:carboxymethylenebutenolidase